MANKAKIYSFPNKKQREKILNRNVDMRLSIVRALRRITGFMLVLSILYFCVAHHDLFRYENLKHMGNMFIEKPESREI